MAELHIPDSCTLPTAERPLRVADFDRFFAGSVRAVGRPEPARLRLELEPGPQTAARAAELAAAEASCCSFFTFVLTVTGQGLTMDITVPAPHTSVLDGLTDLAETARR
jgi:hypothetical protein